MADNEGFLLDKRTIERNIKKGLISRQEYDKYLAGLADVESNAEVIDFGPAEEAAEEAAEAPAAEPVEAAAPAPESAVPSEG